MFYLVAPSIRTKLGRNITSDYSIKRKHSYEVSGKIVTDELEDGIKYAVRINCPLKVIATKPTTKFEHPFQGQEFLKLVVPATWSTRKEKIVLLELTKFERADTGEQEISPKVAAKWLRECDVMAEGLIYGSEELEDESIVQFTVKSVFCYGEKAEVTDRMGKKYLIVYGQ